LYFLIRSASSKQSIIITYSYICRLQKQISIRPFNTRKQRESENCGIRNIHSDFLSFEEICPQWSLALQLGYSNNSNLDIQDAKNCIVGEAHGFRNRGLRCSKCWEYSQSFTFCTYGNKMHKYIVTDGQRFEDLKFEFVSHFNQSHLFNRSCRQLMLDLAVRKASRILLRLRRLSLSFFNYQDFPKSSNMIILSQK
jgi:hypothetical protein